MNKKLTMLMILDGFGNNENKEANSIAIANTPVIDKLLRTNPNTTIKTKKAIDSSIALDIYYIIWEAL